MADTSNKPVESEQSLESQQQKQLKYPRSVFFIISNEFCERFNYYGMRTILVLYLRNKLMFEETSATVWFHVWTMLVYFSCILGAIIADSFIGKFKTILSLSCVYVFGSILLTLGAIERWKDLSMGMTFIGLGLIAVGSGGIKPCVAAFGGEQFKLPEQAALLTGFFLLFYFSINLGSLLSTIVTPILREDVKCFDMPDCFPAGFGLPAVLMALSIIIFVCGKPLYKIEKTHGKMITKVCKTIGNAISTKQREKKTKPQEHWLDYAESQSGKKLVMETKILLNLLVLYIPLPLFWALFDQQASRWVFQASRMDGNIGAFTVKPDQLQVINPLLILVFIPIFMYVFYPMLTLVGIRRPLQKMALGGIFAGAAFLLAMFVQMKIDHDGLNKVSIWWQLPQFTLITLAEVMFSVTGLEFSYTQAPESMKSVIQACWMLTVAIGNLIVIIITGSHLFSNEAIEMLLYAVLMLVDMVLFMYLGYRYKPIPLDELDKISSEEKQ